VVSHWEKTSKTGKKAHQKVRKLSQYLVFGAQGKKSEKVHQNYKSERRIYVNTKLSDFTPKTGGVTWAKYIKKKSGYYFFRLLKN